MTVDISSAVPPVRTTPAIRPDQIGVIEAPFWRVLTFLVLTRTQPTLTDPARVVRHHPPRVHTDSVPTGFALRPPRASLRPAPLRSPRPTRGGVAV